MTVRPIPLGNGSNLDVNESTAQEGMAVSFINCYVDRGNAIRTVPGCVEYVDTGAGNYSTWAYYCVDHGTMIIIAGGRAWKQAAKNAPLVELTGVVIDADYPPAFTEDGTNIFFAANSKIHKVAGDTAVALGGNAPINVTSLAYIGGYLKAAGDAPDGAVPGDTHYSDDKINDYALWEVYNNESRPDALMAIVVAYEQIYNIGRQSLEVTYIDGVVPFSVNKNAAQHFGTQAPKSVAFDGESIYYISEIAASRKIIKLKGGGSPEIISFPVDVPIERFERVDDAQGFMMSFRGQNGYVLTFPTANAEVDEQFWPSITLFFHLQNKQWLILGKFDPTSGLYGPYRGVSFTYVEPWGGLKLIGGRDGKLYRIVENEVVDYENPSVFQHRWRNDGDKAWKMPRTVSLGTTGQYVQHPSIRECGKYRSRQHQFVYIEMSDAGETMRAAVKTGNISHKTPNEKIANFYRYDVECGKPEFVLNSVAEDATVLRQ